MPKRAMTPARKTQIAFWQAASKGKRRSRTNPIPAHNAARGIQRGATVKGSFGAVRRHKLGGKGYQKKSGQTFTPAPEATAILAGKAAFRDPAKAHQQMVSALSSGSASAVAKTNVPKHIAGPVTKAPAQIKQAPIGPQHPAKKGRSNSPGYSRSPYSYG